MTVLVSGSAARNFNFRGGDVVDVPSDKESAVLPDERTLDPNASSPTTTR